MEVGSSKSKKVHTSCVRDNREVVQPPPNNNNNNNESANNNTGIFSLSISDKDLFKVPPQNDDECPICMIRMPWLWSGYVYSICCGKVICRGCIYAVALRDDEEKCPFCRAASPTDKELRKQLENRMENKDPQAIFNLGCKYDKGRCGLRQNHSKAIELWYQAGKLRCASAYHNIGNAYLNGDGVERDMKKAVYYYELAAMGGDAISRYNLGFSEYNENTGSLDREKHHMIAARGGNTQSLNAIKDLYADGHASKTDYAAALRGHQASLDEIKSTQRDEAAAATDGYPYYL